MLNAEAEAFRVPTTPEHEIPLDERLLLLFEAHTAAEADTLATYRRLVEASGDSLTGFIVRLIIDDEERHHELLDRMIVSLRRAQLGTFWPQVMPTDTAPPWAELDELIATTRARIREERRGISELRRIARQDDRLYSGLFAVLLQTMIRDSEKHELLLRFLLKRLEDAARP